MSKIIRAKDVKIGDKVLFQNRYRSVISFELNSHIINMYCKGPLILICNNETKITIR